VRHKRRMLRGCVFGYEIKGVRKLSGECHGRWTVVVMAMFSNIAMRRVHVREYRGRSWRVHWHVREQGLGGRSQTASAWKSLRPRHRMRSLIEPTLVAKLKTITLDRLSQQPYRTHQFSMTDRRAAPGRCLRGSAVEASATYAVTEFHTCVVRVDELVGSDPGEELIKSAPWAGNNLR